MAVYGTTAGVKGWMPNGQTLDDQTDKKPSETTVGGWLVDYSAIIDVHFANAGVALPITDAAVLSLLKVRIEHMMVYDAMALRGQKEEVDEGDNTYLGWKPEWGALLNQIDEHGLGALPATAATGAIWSATMDSVQGATSADSSIDPKVSVGTRY